MLANLLAGSVSPTIWARDVLGVPLVDWQHEVAESFTAGTPRIAACIHRQAGKTWLATVLLAWIVVHRPGCVCLLISQDQRAATEVLDRCRDIVLTAHPHLKPVSDSASRLDLRPAGGRIVSLPASSSAVRGWAKPSVVLLDEAAYIDDDVYNAVTATLARSDGGQLIATSTPRPASAGSWFTRAMLDPELETYWRRYRYSVDDTGLLDESFLLAERAGMTHETYAAEYLADPDISLTGAPFSPALLAGAVDPDLTPLQL